MLEMRKTEQFTISFLSLIYYWIRRLATRQPLYSYALDIMDNISFYMFPHHSTLIIIRELSEIDIQNVLVLTIIQMAPVNLWSQSEMIQAHSECRTDLNMFDWRGWWWKMKHYR